ncbi:hypothetical protein [Psychrobium sp. 1_MG-2023]|uniref:hypothetical protein n=1 Tax=Psychrobium sp. 1_MG-2023 TaxID=3062624 RepID=UPI000C343D0F|nr:hypothetical protein [Psychrobium sp. 1_MG-2023]MDP2562233.1 hypothetical protein [Psychrobium sp. 1_MG-2023]PKF57487.1 hypothetical protein CW748_06225 [Alteromonadales bacterium alter-6D02]
MEKHILAIAKQLTQQGKKPSVALVRAKLSRPVPIPVLVKSLQYFESLSAEQIADIDDAQHRAPSTEKVEPLSDSQKILQQLADLTAEVVSLRKETNELKQLIKERCPNDPC